MAPKSVKKKMESDDSSDEFTLHYDEVVERKEKANVNERMQIKEDIDSEDDHEHADDNDDDDDSESEKSYSAESNQEEEEEEEEDDLNVTYTKKRPYDPNRRDREKLRRMDIEFKSTPPPQHCIEKSAGTRALTEYEKKEFEKHVPLRVGTFSESEDDRIKKNWKQFCKRHNWDPKNPRPFLFMKHNNCEFFLPYGKRIKFVQFLAQGLADRSLYSVYHRFKILYDPHKTSRYSAEEDAVILNYVSKCKSEPNRQFADLAMMLKRTRASVWRRYRVLKKRYQVINDD